MVVGRREIEAGRAFVRLFLKDDLSSQIGRALNSAGQTLRGFGRTTMIAGAGITAVGTAILGPLALFVKSFAQQGNVLDKTSKRTGIAASTLAELGFALEQSSDGFATSEAAIGGLEIGVRRMQKTISDVALGLSTDTTRITKALEVMKVPLEDLVGKTPEEQLTTLLEGIESIGDATYRSGLMTMFFGKSGTELLPMVENLSALRQEARDLHIVPTDEEVANAAKVSDAINRVRRLFKKMMFDIGAALAGPVLKYLDTTSNLAISVGRWVKANSSLILTIAGVGVALLSAGVAVTGFGAAIWGVGMALSVIGTLVAALLSPLGLIVATVVGGTLAWIKFTESGQQAWKALKAVALPIIDEVKTALGAIKDALAAGDWQAAVDVIWALLRLEWTKGVNWLYGKWAGFRDAFLDVWNEATTGLAMIFTEAIGGLRKTWVQFTHFCTSTFWNTAFEIQDAFVKMIPDWLAERMGVNKQLQSFGIGMAKTGVGLAFEQKAAEQVKAIDEETRQRRDVLGQDLSARQDRRDRARRDELAGQEKAVADAQAVFAEAVARAQRATAVGHPGAEPPPTMPGAVAATVPRGVSLTATYSAAAARIAGYQGGGPEQKMAAGIGNIDLNTKQLVGLYQQFLAGWRVP